MNREFSHEYASRSYVNTAHAERAEAIARFGFLVIAGADRGLRRTIEVLSASAGGLIQRWQEYQARRATHRALSALDDRLLRDIGLTRADVELGPNELPISFDEAVPAATRPSASIYELKRAA